MKLIKTIEDKDYTPIVISTFDIIKSRYGYTLRISMILTIIKEIFLGKIDEDFDLIDIRSCNNGPIESYLIDKQIDWQNKKELDFSEIYSKILEYYSLSRMEKLILETGNIEEKLWAFYLALSKPSLE